MIYILTALYAEAKPLIRHLQLKKKKGLGPIQVFASDTIVLTVSGPGPLSAAIGTTFMLSTHPPQPNDLLINFGICGTKSDRFSIGETVIVHKLIDAVTMGSYYPDMLVEHPFQEATLQTFPSPVDSGTPMQAELADMEGTGFYEAASKFLGPHRIVLVKVVADRLQPHTVNIEAVTRLCENALPSLETIMDRYIATELPPAPTLTEKEEAQIIRLCEQWKLSVTLRHQLLQAAKQYKIRTNQELPDLSSWLSVPIENKREGKKYVEQLRQYLLYE